MAQRTKFPRNRPSILLNILIPLHVGGKYETEKMQEVALLHVNIGHVDEKQNSFSKMTKRMKFLFGGVNVCKPLVAPANNILKVNYF